MSHAEVMTTTLATARLFKDNFAMARLFLKSQGYIPTMLSKSTCSEHLHRLLEAFFLLFQVLSQTWKQQEGAGLYLIDSFPVAACDTIRINRCRLYDLEATQGVFRGSIASKRRYVYGVKLHMLVTQDGLPVEVFLTPGSCSDTAA